MNDTTKDPVNQEGVPEKIASDRGWIVHPRYCPSCGNGQQFSDRCERCGTPFPSFTVNVTSAGPGNDRKEGRSFSTNPSWYGFPTDIYGLTVIFGKMSQRVRVTAFSFLIVSLVSMSAGIAQYRSNLQRRYLQNYVLALYGIKSGMELAGRVCDGKYGEWKYGVSSGAPSGIIDPRSLGDLAAVKTEIGEIMGSMGQPPAECEQSARILGKLYSTYDGINSMIINSHGSLSLHQSEITAARKDFSREIENLKASLPASLTEELRKDGEKYDLRFMKL